MCVSPISDACQCCVEPGSLRGSSLESPVFSSTVTEGSVAYSHARGNWWSLLPSGWPGPKPQRPLEITLSYWSTSIKCDSQLAIADWRSVLAINKQGIGQNKVTNSEFFVRESKKNPLKRKFDLVPLFRSNTSQDMYSTGWCEFCAPPFCQQFIVCFRRKTLLCCKDQ